jgi:hypothetical protein
MCHHERGAQQRGHCADKLLCCQHLGTDAGLDLAVTITRLLHPVLLPALLVQQQDPSFSAQHPLPPTSAVAGQMCVITHKVWRHAAAAPHLLQPQHTTHTKRTNHAAGHWQRALRRTQPRTGPTRAAAFHQELPASRLPLQSTCYCRHASAWHSSVAALAGVLLFVLYRTPHHTCCS